MPDLVLESGSRPVDARDRLIEATTRIATERGFEALDAERVARAAGLTLADFQLHFDSVDQGLLAAFDQFVERILEHASDASEGIPSWPERVRAAIVAGLEFIAELEPVTRLFAVDALTAGAGLVERKISAIELAAERLKEGRELYPEAAELPDSMERTLVAGLVIRALTYLLGEEAGRLAEVQAELVEIVLIPYLGLEGARLAAA
jgi:AcrR family transcriptional regulator